MNIDQSEILLSISPNSPTRLEIKGCTRSAAHKAILSVLAGQLWSVAFEGLKAWKKSKGEEPSTPSNEVYEGFRLLVGDVTETFIQEISFRPIREILSRIDFEDKKRFANICNRVFSGRVLLETNEVDQERVDIKLVDAEANTKYFNFLLDSVKAILIEWTEISGGGKVAPKLAPGRATPPPAPASSEEDLGKADALIKKVIDESDFSNL